MFHNVILLSHPAENIYLPSGEKVAVNISFELDEENLCIHFPVEIFQSLKDLSQEELNRNPLSDVIDKSDIKWLWPFSVMYGIPLIFGSSISSFLDNIFQIIINLSLDPEIIRSFDET